MAVGFRSVRLPSPRANRSRSAIRTAINQGVGSSRFGGSRFLQHVTLGVGMTGEFDVVVDDVGFGEGLRWRDGALWFSDIARGEVSHVEPGTDKAVVLGGLVTPAGLGWTNDGRLLVVSIQESRILTERNGEPAEFVDL